MNARVTPRTRVGAPADAALIARFNQTRAPFRDDVTIHQLFEEAALIHARRIAVVCDHDRTFRVPSITYEELNGRANQVAHRLRAEGVGAGDVVALVAERSYAMVIGLLGILKAGAAYLPAPPATPPERMRYMLEEAHVRVVLCHDGEMDPAAFAGTVIRLDDIALYAGEQLNPPPIAGPTDLAYVIFTSGSTGRPKGVMIEHRALVNRLQWMQHAYPIGPSDVLLQKTPYAFDVSVWELLWWSLYGARVCMLAPGAERNPMALSRALSSHRVSVVHFVPSMLNAFLEHLAARPGRAGEAMGSVRRVFASGEALTPTHVARFNEIVARHTAARLTNLYGPTEAAIDVTSFDCPPDAVPAVVPIGRPIHNVRLVVVRDGAHAGIGVTGELCIAGVALARGYANNPALTRERFVDDPGGSGDRVYRTGDLARWRADGTVEYLGRADDQVKIRGIRIELGEIENTIREHPAVADVAVVVERPSENIARIIAHVVPRASFDAAGLGAFLRRRLPDYMMPNRIVETGHIPLTPSGKADRRALTTPALHMEPA